jgi:hypothetical protein
MAEIVESIDISRRPGDVFAYAADFSHFPEWRRARPRHVRCGFESRGDQAGSSRKSEAPSARLAPPKNSPGCGPAPSSIASSAPAYR